MKAKLKTPNPEAVALLRQAAKFGPGHRGTREDATAEQRAQVRERLESLGLDPPVFLDQEQTWVDRKAKLFEAGEYPDKGVCITVENLSKLTTTFDLPVPVLIEHARNPLQIGYLTDVRQEGSELFGSLALTKEANDLIEASSAHALSLGLDASLTEIREVSLVKSPRVASARMFHGEVLEPNIDWKAEYQRLQRDRSVHEAGQRLEALVAEGRILPAQVPFAQALMAQTTTIEFDGESVPTSTLLLEFIERGPKHSLLSEFAVVTEARASMAPEERAFYDRYFAGLSLEEIAKHRATSSNP